MQYKYLGENRGFSGNVNAGLDEVDGDIIILSNDDVIPLQPDWPAMIKQDLQDKEVAAVGPRSNYILNHQLWNQPGPELEIIPAISFMWVAIPRRAWEKVGRLDEDFGLGLCEDLDWSWRARKMGLHLLLDRRIVFWHWGSQTISQLANVKELDAENRKKLREKHGEAM